MTLILPVPDLKTLGAPVLREVARAVPPAEIPHLAPLIQNLLTVMSQEHGVGIAAPQIGRSLRVMVVASRPNLRYPDAPLMEPLVLINPELVQMDLGVVWGWEGCLSIPQQRGWVGRSPTVTVRFHQADGTLATQTFTDFVARIVQHEYDHLQGVLWVDRSIDRVSEAEYQRRQGSHAG
ncbi:MAG: peptide deformylase [Oscillatoriales cyanobacterium SM2_2_1]|nr:peptide deformylase [Oscillatoriales cyanobacterium SM2_2_1]